MQSHDSKHSKVKKHRYKNSFMDEVTMSAMGIQNLTEDVWQSKWPPVVLNWQLGLAYEVSHKN